MASIPERVATLEEQVRSLPDIMSDIGTLKSRDDRSKGRNDVLRALVTIAAGSGILSLIADLIMLSRR